MFTIFIPDKGGFLLKIPFVLLRTSKVYPRGLEKMALFSKCAVTRERLVNMEFLVHISGNHDLDFTNSHRWQGEKKTKY